MTKRILSCLVVLAMLVSVLPISAVRAEASEPETVHTHEGWTALGEGAAFPSAPGKYYLTADMELTSHAIPAAGEVTLCLCGHDLIQKGATYVLYINSGVHVTICDCTAKEENGLYTAGAIRHAEGVSTSVNGSAAFVCRGGSLTLDSGSITGNTSTNADNGGTVYLQANNATVNGGAFTMNGGRITGNISTKGGAVHVKGSGSTTYTTTPATFTMTGGVIENNLSTVCGTICATGTGKPVIAITGGIIRNNQAGDAASNSYSDTKGNGGALFLRDDAQVTVENTEISGNVAHNSSGGAIFARDDVALSIVNSKITGNTTLQAGAVYIQNRVVLTLTDTTVSGNTSEKSFAGGVYVTSNTNKLTAFGKVVIAYNTCASNDGRENMQIANASAKPLYVNGLTQGADIRYRTADTSETDAAKLIAIAEGGKQETWDPHWITVNGEAVSLVDGAFVLGHYHGNVKYEPWVGGTSHNTLPSGSSNYYLANDILRNTDGGTVTIAKGTTQRLCLNGYTITHRNPTGRLYVIQGTFILEDCTARTDSSGNYISGGITYGGETASTRSYGIFFNIQSGYEANFVMEDGQIYGLTNTAKNYEAGVAVYIQGASTTKAKAVFTMNGGMIHSITTLGDGAAVHLAVVTSNANTEDPSQFNMNGGKIVNNSTTGTGSQGGRGAIYAANAKVTITGGEITGNTAKVGGTVYVEPTTQLTVSGTPQIHGNTGGNLYLAGDQTFTASGMEENAELWISVGEAERKVAVLDDEKRLGCFRSDDKALVMSYREGGVWLEISDAHSHCVCNASLEGCDHVSAKWRPWDNATTLPTVTGNYYLLSDVNLTEGTTIPADQNVKLCLNGKTVTGTRLLLIQKNSTLSITDCVGTGTITGGNRNYGGAINVNRMATLNLYGGTITGNTAGKTSSASSLGGGVYLQAGKTDEPGAVFNMYGGTISGNSGYQGGGIYVAAGEVADATPAQLNIYGGTISGNTAGGEVTNADGTVSTKGGSGAAIYVGKYGMITMTGGTITGNSGLGYGGTIYLSGATGTFSGGAISENISAKDGGGLYAVSASQVQISGDVVFRNNKSTGGAGGGFGASSKSQVIMTGGTVSGNYAVQGGGAIIQSGAKLIMTGGTFTGNESKAYGGAVYVNTPNADGTLSSMYLQGGTITANKSGNAAGGIYCKEGYLEMTGGTISKNETANYGCGIYYMRATGKVTGGTITQNTSGKDGAGIYCYAGEVEIGGDVKITYNTSLKGAGGGLGFSKESKSKLTGGTITGNSAAQAGGIIVQSQAHLTMTGGYVANNSTKGSGGGVYVNKASMDLYGGTIAYNKSTKTGAGLFANESTTNFGGTAFVGNEATANGGAFYINKGTANITGGTYKNNSSQRYGGGLCLINANVTIKNVKVIGNYAKLGSGGMHGYGGKITMENCLFSENTTDSAAGGLCVTKLCELVMTDCVVEKNEANNGGGVLVQNYSTAILNNVIIRDNTACEAAGMQVYSTDAEVTVNGGAITGNEAITKLDKSGQTVGGRGAGILLNSGRSTYSGRSDLYLNGVTIEGNTAATSGGGIYVDMQMVCYLDGCTVQNNTAGTSGAGIYQASGTKLFVKNSKLLANTAGATGSAIYAGSDFTLENSTITGNKTSDGCAVYVAPARYDGHSYMNAMIKLGGDLQLCDNEGTMQDLYLDEGVAAAVTAEGFGENTRIGVQLHSGVLTNSILGVYDYEGGDLIYTITYGDRSLTDSEYVEPTKPMGSENDTQQAAPAKTNTALYVGIGIAGLLAIAAIVLVALKKEKAGKSAEEANKE